MANYGTVSGADAYHLAAGNTAWTGTNEVKLAALVRASQYVDALALEHRNNGSVFTRFSGVKTAGRGQMLSWPRAGAYDVEGTAIAENVVPIEVESATYEAALRELVQPGYLSPDYVPAQTIKREKVDVLETEYMDMADHNRQNKHPRLHLDNPQQPISTLIRSIIAPLIVAWGANDVGVMVV